MFYLFQDKGIGRFYLDMVNNISYSILKVKLMFNVWEYEEDMNKYNLCRFNLFIIIVNYEDQ